MAETPIPEWRVEYPSSRTDVTLPRHAYTFYDESEALDFRRGLGDLPGIVVSRREITVSEWVTVPAIGSQR
jgi:hypothetical protein